MFWICGIIIMLRELWWTSTILWSPLGNYMDYWTSLSHLWHRPTQPLFIIIVITSQRDDIIFIQLCDRMNCWWVTPSIGSDSRGTWKISKVVFGRFSSKKNNLKLVLKKSGKMQVAKSDFLKFSISMQKQLNLWLN